MKSIYVLEYNELNISVILKSKTEVLDTIWNELRKKSQSIILKMGKLKVIEIDQKPHKCPKCKVRFTNRKNILRHLKKVHEKNGPNFQCIICKKLYTTKGNHDQHFNKTHMIENLLYTEPEKVKVNGKQFTTYSQSKNNHLISVNLYYIVRKMRAPKLVIKRKSKAKSKQNSTAADSSKQYVFAHFTYGNPFGKVHFSNSETANAAEAFEQRRQMVNDFEFT